MQSTQKVNQLIDMIEKKCLESCTSENQRAKTGLELNDDIYFVYHKDIGLMMFHGKVWYTDEARIDRVVKVSIPNMREKLIQLVDEFYVDIKEIERMAFELS